MKRILQYLFFSFMTFPLFSAEFSTLSLKGWDKEELSFDHLRFTHPKNKNITIHLQVDRYDPNETWNNKTLSQDIADMVKKRRTMSALLGITNYQVQSSQYQVTPTQNILDLTGSYSRLGHQLIYFREVNFYHREHFLQFKIISETDLATFNSESLIRELNPEQVDID